jgi:hypothetical protein
MSAQPCIARIRMINNVFQVNIRALPGAGGDLLGKAPTGLDGLIVLDVQPDRDGAAAEGKTFQWFQLRFPDGMVGWVRDDLLEIVGDCARFGYGSLDAHMRAFGILRQPAPVEPAPAPAPAPIESSAPRIDDAERVRRAAFNITAGFEGGGYDSYQNHDSGVVSYGRFQFTLASGNLFSVVDAFARASSSPAAMGLRARFLQRIQNRDESLRHDTDLRALLISAAAEPAMQAVQDAIATEQFWNRAQNLSTEPRGLLLPLSRAFIFDMAINHGLFHDLLNVAERALNIPLRVRLVEIGIDERTFITRVTQARRDRLHRIADTRRLPGLKVRGDFWVGLVERGDWALQGDADGTLEIKQGRRVQVHNP